MAFRCSKLCYLELEIKLCTGERRDEVKCDVGKEREETEWRIEMRKNIFFLSWMFSVTSGVEQFIASIGGNFFFSWRNSPTRTKAASFFRFLDHTQWHTTVCRTPPDEGSARSTDLYTHTQHSQRTTIHAPGGVRTRNPSKLSAVNTRLRPLGHWNRRKGIIAQRNNGCYTKFETLLGCC